MSGVREPKINKTMKELFKNLMTDEDGQKFTAKEVILVNAGVIVFALALCIFTIIL